MKTYGTLTYANDTWTVAAEPDVTVRLKRIFPRARQNDLNRLTLQHTPEVSRDLEMILTRWPMNLDAVTESTLRDGADSHRAQAEHVNDILRGAAAHVGLPLAPHPAMTPRPYQRIAYDLLCSTGGLLLADDLGLGKTLVGMLSLSDPAKRPLLVVTLTGLPRQWIRELGKTFPDLLGHEVTKATPYDMTDPDGRTPDMIVMNYAKLPGWAAHLQGRVSACVFDEVQELRNTGTQRHAAALSVARGVPVLGLSATPVYNYGGEMHSIMSVIRPDLLGSLDEFGREWCKTTYGLSPKTRISDPAAFRAFLLDNGAMLHRTRADVGISLPDVVPVEQYVDADEAALDAAAGDAAEIARIILAADTNHVDRFQAAGEIDWRMRQATGIAKAPFVAAFTRLLLDSQDKVILLGWHRAVWDLWLERLADFNPVLYTGSETVAQKARAFEAFTTDPKCRLLMLSLRSGAGLDGLQDVCSNMVFGEIDWSPGVHKQGIGRILRPGQKRGGTAYFCISDRGSDPVMAQVLNVKKIEADLLFSPTASANIDPVDPVSHGRLLAEAVLARRPARRPTH